MCPSSLLVSLTPRCRSCSCAIGIRVVSDILHVPFLERSAAFPHQLHKVFYTCYTGAVLVGGLAGECILHLAWWIVVLLKGEVAGWE